MKSPNRLPGLIAALTLTALLPLTGCDNRVDHIDLDAGILQEDIRIAIERANEEARSLPSAVTLPTKVTSAKAAKQPRPE